MQPSSSWWQSWTNLRIRRSGERGEPTFVGSLMAPYFILKWCRLTIRGNPGLDVSSMLSIGKIVGHCASTLQAQWYFFVTEPRGYGFCSIRRSLKMNNYLLGSTPIQSWSNVLLNDSTLGKCRVIKGKVRITVKRNQSTWAPSSTSVTMRSNFMWMSIWLNPS